MKELEKIKSHSEYKIHFSGSYFNKFSGFLSEFVYGGIDGAVTTFAVVSGSMGANLSLNVIVILGFANLIADGFAMSVGKFLSSKSELAQYNKMLKLEKWEVEKFPKEEKEEIENIYKKMGFEGENLNMIVEKITSNKSLWVETMMIYEHNVLPPNNSPLSESIATFLSFIIVGFIPVFPFLFIEKLNISIQYAFLISAIFTCISFVLIGLMKSIINKTRKIVAILETLLLGCIASALSFYVGNILENIFK